jgi:hypothetical protein
MNADWTQNSSVKSNKSQGNACNKG